MQADVGFLSAIGLNNTFVSYKQSLSAKKNIYTLKEVEKNCSAKGIVVQSVPEILESLLGDNLVTTEKIGTSNYYWSFPNEAIDRMKNDIEELTAKEAALTLKNKEIEDQIESIKEKDDHAQERIDLIAQLSKYEEEHKLLTAEFELSKELDPIEYNKKVKLNEDYIRSAEEWSDNTYGMVQWLSKKTGKPTSEIHKSFNVPTDV